MDMVVYVFTITHFPYKHFSYVDETTVRMWVHKY